MKAITQSQAVRQAMEKLGGMATLAQLYRVAVVVPGSDWTKTKTPFASIRRIVQLDRELYRIRPGLYALKSHRTQLEAQGIVAGNARADAAELRQFTHAYYQGMLLMLGTLRGHACWAPNQDRHKLFGQAPLERIRTLEKIPAFSFEHVVRRSQTVDVIWFNERRMPRGFFEVEHSTDFQNSLVKFSDLQDFNSRMVVVADRQRRPEFDRKLRYSAFSDICRRVEFLSYESLVRQYETAHRLAAESVVL